MISLIQQEKTARKIKFKFVLSDVAGEVVAVSVGAPDRNVVLRLNATAKFMWDMLTVGTDVDALAAALVERYDGLDEEDARAEAEEFVEMLRGNRLLDE